MNIKETMKEILETSIEKGFWKKGSGAYTQAKREDRIPEVLCLIHSEVSEALEEYREGIYNYNIQFEEPLGLNGGKPAGFAIEIADTVIRCLDLAAALDIDLEEAIRVKMDYNKTRPFKHGGKVC